MLKQSIILVCIALMGMSSPQPSVEVKQEANKEQTDMQAVTLTGNEKQSTLINDVHVLYQRMYVQKGPKFHDGVRSKKGTTGHRGCIFIVSAQAFSAEEQKGKTIHRDEPQSKFQMVTYNRWDMLEKKEHAEFSINKQKYSINILNKDEVLRYRKDFDFENDRVPVEIEIKKIATE